MQHGTQILPNSKFQIPSFRVSGAPPWVCTEGRQNPDSMFPSVQTPGYSSANSRFRVSEFPGPLRGSAEGSQNPDSMFPHGQIPGYSSANSRFQDSERADSRILLWAYSRFRVSEFPRPPLGSEPKGRPPNSRFRVSEFPRPPLASSVQGRGEGLPDSRFRVSEFPRTPLGSQQV